MRKLELIVGLFVLSGIAAAVFLAVKIGGSQILAGDSYVLNARFNSVAGLNEGSRVVIGGVRVGTVSKIRLQNEDFVAIAELSLNKDLILPDDTMASIKSSGLIGDKYITLSPGGSEVLLKEGDTIVDTESSVSIEELIGNFAFGSINQEDEGEDSGDGGGAFDLGLDSENAPPTPEPKNKEDGNNE